MKFSAVFLLLFLFFTSISFSQVILLQGKVFNEDGQTLQGAHVHIDDKFAIADQTGKFKVSGLEEGGHFVSVTYIGLQTLDTVLFLKEDARIDFVLKEDLAGLAEVFVSGSPQRRTSENLEVVGRDYLQDHYKGSLANTLGRLPGINSVEIGAGTSKPIIRGLGFNRIAVTENGVKQEGQQWGADHGLEIDALNVEGVEVVKGVGAIENGSDAIGGVIKIINDKVPEKGLKGEFIGLGKTINKGVTASANLSYRKDKFFYKFKATGTEFGDYTVPTDEIIYLSRRIPIYDEQLKNTAGKETDLYAQVGYLGSRYKGTFSLSNVDFKSGFFPGSHGVPSVRRVARDGDARNIDYPFQKVNHFKLINKNEWFFRDSTLEVILGFQNNHRQEWSRFHTHYSGQEPPEENPDLELDFNLNTFDSQLKFTKEFSGRHTSSIGIQSQVQDNTIKGYNFLLPEYFRTNTGIYFTHEFQASDDIKLSLGTRFDYSEIAIEEYYDELLYEHLLRRGQSPELAAAYAERSPDMDRDFSNFNFMAGFLKNFNENWNVSLNAGTSFRLPTAIEFGANGIHHGSFRHEQGNANLNAEKGYVFDTSLNFSQSGYKVSLSPYFYYFDNYIFLNPSGSFSVLPHAGQIYKFTQTEAVLTGVEMEFEKTFYEKVRTLFNFEYLYNQQVTKDKTRNFPLPFTPPVNGFGEVGFLFSKDGSMFRNSEVFASTRFALKQDRIAQQEEITPGYQIFGGGLRTTFQVGDFQADLHLQVSNIFNTKYFNHTNFYRALEIPEMGRNIQLMLRIPINK